LLDRFHPGQLLFELSFGDREFQVPVITTYICIGQGEWTDSPDENYFLIVDGLISADGDRNIACLTDEQAAELLDLKQLIDGIVHLPQKIVDFESLVNGSKPA